MLSHVHRRSQADAQALAKALTNRLERRVEEGEKEGLEEISATNLLRNEAEGSRGRARRAFQVRSARSIMGATEKRRDGLGRVVAGFKAVSANIWVRLF
jgi:hypothetical protein